MTRPTLLRLLLLLAPCTPGLATAQPRPAAPRARPPAEYTFAAPPGLAARAPPEPDPAPRRAPAAEAWAEPEVAALQEAAAREADRGVPDAGSYPARARLAALLPRVTAEYRREEQSNRVVGLQGSGEVDYLRLAPGNTYLVRATWDLGLLVAAPGELQAATQAAARAQRRAEAVARVTRLHFERRKLRVALLLDPPAEPLARAQAELEIERLGAELDALTGGLATGRGR